MCSRKEAKNTYNLITANQLFKAHKASTLCKSLNGCSAGKLTLMFFDQPFYGLAVNCQGEGPPTYLGTRKPEKNEKRGMLSTLVMALELKLYVLFIQCAFNGNSNLCT